MDKFQKGGIDWKQLGLSYNDRIQKWIDAGKTQNVQVTWKQAKDNYRLTPRNLRRIASRKKIEGKR